MNTKSILKNIVCGFILAGISVSCSDIEFYPDGRISYEDIFSNERKTGAYLNTCYSHIQLYGMWYGNNAFLSAFTDDAQDANNVNNSAAAQWYQGRLTPYSNPVESGSNTGWWTTYFAGIRHCNIFLANIGSAKIYSEKTRRSWEAQAHILRAFYYWNLIKRYGGVPLSTEEYSLDYDYSKIERSSFNEVVELILSDCDKALSVSDEELPWRSGTVDEDRGKMHKGLAWAIKSQAALFAASPLWDDGTISWEQAAKITQKAVEECKAHGYDLYKKDPGKPASYSAYDTYFYSQSDVAGTEDKETVFEIKNRMEIYRYHGLPIILGAENAGTSPSQELIDCYETIDGKQPILGYQDKSHLQPVINHEATLYDENNPYANRDPRLQASIYYNGSQYRLDDANSIIETCEGGNCAISLTDVRMTRTGYYLRKYANWHSDKTNNQDGFFKLFRYAELLLNYAEAANEASINNIAPNDAVDAINEVRNRAGMPSVPYGISQDEFRAKVRNERRVEFAFEEHRFFDVRRWKILSETDHVVTGMKAVKTGDRTYSYQRFVVNGERKAYEDKYLMFPIPGDEVVRMLNYTGKDFQNPGWVNK